MHKLADYPIRPSYQQGESLGGFLSRHFCSNGHEIPKSLGDALAKLYKSKLMKDRIEAWDLLCKSVGTVPENYRRLWIEEQFTYSRPSFIGLDEHWQKPLTRQFRICPQCLKKFGFHLAVWDLPFVLACPTHNKFLIGRCDCGKVLCWKELKPCWTCSCGNDLRQLSADPAPRSLVNTALSIAATAGFHVPDLLKQQTEKFRVADCLQSTYSIFSWLHLLLREMRTYEDDKAFGATPLPWRFGSVLSNWPGGLIRHIRHVITRWHQDEHDELMVHLPEKSRAKELLLLLRYALRTTAMPQNLREAIQTFVNDLDFKPLASNRWVLNPALTTSQREDKNREIQCWWGTLLDWMELSDMHVTQETQLHDDFDQNAIDISVKILNILSRAAADPTSAQRFRRFAKVWPPCPADATTRSPKDFIELLGHQLIGMSSSHREYLYELCLDAGEVKNAAR